MILTPCIDRVTLLMLEDGALEAGAADATRVHVAACGHCGNLAAELAELGEVVGRFASTRAAGSCPDKLVLASYAEGHLDAGERADCEAHLAGCGQCAADLAALGRELAGLETNPGVVIPAWALARAHALVEAGLEPTAAPARTGDQRGSWMNTLARFRGDPFPAAALASVALIVLLQLPRPGNLSPRIRGPQRGSVDEIALVAPTGGGSLTDARGVLRWEPVPGAGTYTVSLVDSAGTLIWTGESSRPEISIPANLPLTPGASYSWWVETVLDSGDLIESPLSNFTVAH